MQGVVTGGALRGLQLGAACRLFTLWFRGLSALAFPGGDHCV